LGRKKIMSSLGEQIDGDLSPEVEYDPRALLIYGGGGHGKSLIDLVRCTGNYDLVGIIDDGLAAGTDVMGVPVLGGSDVLQAIKTRGVHLAVNAVGGVGNVDVRVDVFQRLYSAGYTCPTLVHPTAFVEKTARLGSGAQILPLVYIGTEAEVGAGVIVNNGAIVSHDCRLGEYSSLAPGAILAGGVVLGSRAQVGMGVTINLHVAIGEGARVGNSAVIKQDVPAGKVVRAGAIWPERKAE
jgi:acetyltransferase EpsM